MTINTLYFMLVFLPISLILYYLVPKPLKTPVLVLESFVFYAWGSPVTLVLLLLSLLFNYVTGLEITALSGQQQKGRRKAALIVGILGNVLVLCAYKYTGFFLENLKAITGITIAFTAKTVPVGLSFYTFTVLSYIIDVYTGKGTALKNPLDFAVYAAFFPKIVSGPIVKYEEFGPQLKDHPVSRKQAYAGVSLFLVGLFKKVILADKLGTVFSAISGLQTMSVGSAWLGVLCYGLQLYFDFSGYSDMAIGLSSLFGFTIAPNFDHPYTSLNIGEFWRRWHISLGAWFRNYIYIPLGGNRRKTGRVILNFAAVWLLTGFWHGASWSFILWGVYHGIFVVLERFVIKDHLDWVPRPLRIVGTFVIVTLGWVLFFSGSLGASLHYYGQMFGAGHMGLLDATAKYYLSSSWLLLAAGLVGCGTLPQRLHRALTYRAGPGRVYLSAALYVLLLLVCIAGLVSATYTTFLYVQF